MRVNEGAEGRNPIAHNDSSRSITRSRIGIPLPIMIALDLLPDLELGFFLNSEK